MQQMTHIAVINLATNAVTGKIPVVEGPERIYKKTVNCTYRTKAVTILVKSIGYKRQY
jgi:hypothetical protein